MQGNYQTDQPTGLGHLPALLARLLEQSYRDQRTRSATLCDKNVVHIGTSVDKSKLGAGDWAWGCGYRNLQMVFSTIISRPEFVQPLLSYPLLRPAIIHALHAPSIAIPSIHLWQTVIQDAWNIGFDPDGAAHFSGHLIGKKQWIGTTEVYVALSRLGLKCQIIDFPKPSAPNGQHIKLIQWVENYFNSTSNLTDNDRKTENDVKTHPEFVFFGTKIELDDKAEDRNNKSIPITQRSKIPNNQSYFCSSPLMGGMECWCRKIAAPLKKVCEQMSASHESSHPQTDRPLHQPGGGESSLLDRYPSDSLLRSTKPLAKGTRNSKPTELDLRAYPKLLGAHRLTLKELSKKKQYQVPKPADSDPDQHKLHTIRSLRIL
ncbi:hypothetical protein KEM48_001470 [Puccinia striiformis f. sp. tritici PST-130]|nr:hypothetical protein KEM48_001470 [Puccinia striiformis f. sp. tritici PST-130]